MIKIVLNRLISFLNALNIYLILPMLVFIVLADILLRFFVNSPIIWAHEVCGLLLICLFFLAIPSCIQNKQLLHVDIVYKAIGAKPKVYLSYLHQFLLLGFASLLICQGYLGVRDSLEYQERAYTINIPYWPFYGLTMFIGLISFGQSWLGLFSRIDLDPLENHNISEQL